MGYACPVCETPQADARHLANHLAFTAMVRGGDHEEWLDEHVPDWEEAGERELAERATAFAEEEDYPQVFEDTLGTSGEHQHDHERSGRLFDDDSPDGRSSGDEQVPHAVDRPERPPMDDETRAIYEEAREMTEAMLDDASEGDDAESDEE